MIQLPRNNCLYAHITAIAAWHGPLNISGVSLNGVSSSNEDRNKQLVEGSDMPVVNIIAKCLCVHQAAVGPRSSKGTERFRLGFRNSTIRTGGVQLCAGAIIHFPARLHITGNACQFQGALVLLCLRHKMSYLCLQLFVSPVSVPRLFCLIDELLQSFDILQWCTLSSTACGCTSRLATATMAKIMLRVSLDAGLLT